MTAHWAGRLGGTMASAASPLMRPRTPGRGTGTARVSHDETKPSFRTTELADDARNRRRESSIAAASPATSTTTSLDVRRGRRIRIHRLAGSRQVRQPSRRNDAKTVEETGAAGGRELLTPTAHLQRGELEEEHIGQRQPHSQGEDKQDNKHGDGQRPCPQRSGEKA